MADYRETIRTPSQNITSSQTGKVFIDDAQDRLIAYDGINNLALFGKDDAGQVVVKVAKPGFDANSATDDQLIFNSNQNIFKIIYSGVVTLPAVTLPAGAATARVVSFTHNLGYIPVVNAYAYVQDNVLDDSLNYIQVNGYQPLPFDPMINDPNVVIYRIKAIANISTIDFYALYRTTGSGFSWPATDIRYYIMQETQN